MKLIWINDPKDGKDSVTLTIVVLSTVAMIVSIGLELMGKAKGTSLITDFFWGSLATYLGRRIGFGNKGASVGVVDAPETKV